MIAELVNLPARQAEGVNGVVDYVACSPELFPGFNSFHVEEPYELSDHSAVHFNLQTQCHTTQKNEYLSGSGAKNIHGNAPVDHKYYRWNPVYGR